MNRRNFILSSAAGTAAMLARHVTAGATEERAIPAIDTHIHLYDTTRPQGVPWPPRSETALYRPHLPADFRQVAAPCRVVGAVVVEASEWVDDNQWVLNLAPKNPEIVGLVGNLRPGKPTFGTDLRRFAANPLFRGLRLRGSDLTAIGDPAVDADLRRMADADLSVDAIGGPAILAPALKLAQFVPPVRIIINHLPFKDWDGNVPAMRAALSELARRPNVYVKVSEVVRRVNDRVVEDPEFYRPGLDALFELFGPDRLVFGSNWPVSNRVAPYDRVHRVVADYFLAKGRPVAEAYFWRNSFAAYRWVPRGEAGLLLL